jgi:hypothetical protein
MQENDGCSSISLANRFTPWDERDHEFQYFYDSLHRPTYSIVMHGDGASLNNIFDKIIYGETI